MKTPVRVSRILILVCSVSALLYVVLTLSQGRRTFAQPVQSEEPTAQETYVSQVIIQAPWAEKNLYRYAGGEESPPGEFGHYVTEETELGPNSFAVAPNGEIYINDPLNKRIQRFGPNGEFISVVPINGGFICVDRDNNIYTTRASRPHWFIDKYDQAGNLLKSYPIDVEDRTLYDIYCDNSGRVFTEFLFSRTEMDEARRTLADTTWHGVCQVGDGERVFSLEEQKSLARRDLYLGSNSIALEKGWFLVPDRGLVWGHGNLYWVDVSGDTVQVLRSLRGELLGCDEETNIYTKQYDFENRVRIIRKYNQQGKLVSLFQCTCGSPYVGLFKGGLRYQFLDAQGNLYVFCQSHQDGIQVTKWYKAD